METGCRSRCSDYAIDWNIRGSIPGMNKRYFSPSKRLDRLWGPHCLLFKGKRGLLGGSVNLATHLKLAPRLRIIGSISKLPHISSCRGKGLSCL